MTGFEPRISGVGSNRSANWTTTTGHDHSAAQPKVSMETKTASKDRLLHSCSFMFHCRDRHEMWSLLSCDGSTPDWTVATTERDKLSRQPQKLKKLTTAGLESNSRLWERMAGHEKAKDMNIGENSCHNEKLITNIFTWRLNWGKLCSHKTCIIF